MDSKTAKTMIGIVCVAAWLASPVLGCSPVRGGDPVADNNGAAWTLGIIAILPVLFTIALYFLRRRKGLALAITSSVLIAIHPAWTFSAGGDCGSAKLQYAKWFTGLLILLAAIQLALWLLSRGSARTTMA